MYTPRRVVALSPNISMILFALGADAVVVGRTQDCVPAIQQYLRVWRIPEHTVAQRLLHWQELPVVGAWPLADRESVKTLQPEAILTSGSGLFGVHLAPDLIRLSGGVPLFTQPGDTAKWVAFDEIRAAQPDMILQFDCHGCPTARKHPIPRRPGWSELAAVARKAVYPLSANISDPNLFFPAALEELMGVLNTFGYDGVWRSPR